MNVAEFRSNLCAWLDENDLTPSPDDHSLDAHHAQHSRVLSVLYDAGWMRWGWPESAGGLGGPAILRAVVGEEVVGRGLDEPGPYSMLEVLAPTLIDYARPELAAEMVPLLLSGRETWCQGFSEPGSGSDLASLRTKAEKNGDKYIVNGQKIWTTLAQYADWIFCLVRTDPAAKQQEGISFLLIDMKTPGVTVRPIVTIDGGREVNEVFFDNVEVPAENLVGQENKGWDYAKFLLGNERTGIARVGMSKARIARIKELAALEFAGERPLIETPRFQEKLAAIEVELKALEMTQLRVVSDERKLAKGRQNPASSILKLKGSVIQQQLTELLMEVVGPYVMPYQRDFDGNNEPAVGPDYASEAAPLYFNYRKVSIYGGSNEIQRNIIAKAILGL
jgi:alkylation response protein AidB-like acyl-CoA dehydrogenase